MSCRKCPCPVEEENDIKDTVRTVYGNVAEETSAGRDCGNVASCCGASCEQDIDYARQLGYSEEECKNVPDGANMGLGCGNPSAIAALTPGETVLDLGSGGGFDCFLAARKIGPTGHVIGVDMTPSMVSKARMNADKGGYKNVEFRLGEIENIPASDGSVDVVISNCVINLSTNKRRVFEEMARILKPGGRIAITDIVALRPLPESVKSNKELYVGCIAGAMLVDEVREALASSGFKDIKIQVKETSGAFVAKWSSGFKAEEYVASANIEGIKGRDVL